jgi:hypothetical protein
MGSMTTDTNIFEFAGREANVVIWDGDPFALSTRAVQVFGKLQKRRSQNW